MTTMTYAMRDVTDEELGAHASGPEENWQESWGFAWHDPIRKAGGLHHLHQWRNRGYADVWSWTVLEGRLVGQYQNLRLPLPDADYPHWECGGQRVTTHGSRHCSLRAEYPDVVASVDYEAAHAPSVYSPAEADGIHWGKSHWESIGRVAGSITVAGETTQVSGLAFQDHSWGPRHWVDALSHRWLFAGFGASLCISATVTVTEHGPRPLPWGYVYDNGEAHQIEAVTTGARMADDGHSPAGCDTRIWTKDGIGYHVTGQVHTAVPSSHEEGFWMTDGLCVFECGGRLGAGIYEVAELRGVPPYLRGQLGL
jgi:hypothetical protein